jgi:hypothetical protein
LPIECIFPSLIPFVLWFRLWTNLQKLGYFIKQIEVNWYSPLLLRRGLAPPKIGNVIKDIFEVKRNGIVTFPCLLEDEVSLTF